MFNLILGENVPFFLFSSAPLCVGLALVAAVSVRPAHALLTYNIFETTDGNVVSQTDGSLNLPAQSVGFSECEDTDGDILSIGGSDSHWHREVGQNLCSVRSS